MAMAKGQDNWWSECPSQSLLRRFLRGELDPSDIELVAEHVDACVTCSATLVVLGTSSNASGHIGTHEFGATHPFPGRGAQEEETDETRLRERLQQLIPQTHAPLGRERFVREVAGVAIPPTVGQYRLDECLGQGAMGIVFKAWHRRLKRPMVLKILLPTHACEPRRLRQFEHEMEAVGALGDHKNLIRATDAAEDAGLHFIVMEYTPGIDVSTLITRVGALRPADACEIARQAACGLHHAHRNGILHRDVKPSNLFLTSDGIVKVLDLGLAAFHEAPESLDTDREYVVGTADYLPPERWNGEDQLQPASDVYSLGCTLYKLLTGKPPYSNPGMRVNEKRLAHLSAPVPSVRDSRPGISVEIEQLLRRMMAKNANDRFPHADDVASVLAPLCRGESLAKMASSLIANTSDTDRMSLEQTLLTRIRTAMQPKSWSKLVWPVCVLLAFAAAWFNMGGGGPNQESTVRPSKAAERLLPTEEGTAIWKYNAEQRRLTISSNETTLISWGDRFDGRGGISTRVALLSPAGEAGIYYGYRTKEGKNGRTHHFAALLFHLDETSDVWRLEHVPYEVFESNKGPVSWMTGSRQFGEAPILGEERGGGLYLQFDQNRLTMVLVDGRPCELEGPPDGFTQFGEGGIGFVCVRGNLRCRRPAISPPRLEAIAGHL